VESGKRSDNRPQLAAAIAACKKQKAKLVIAKLDRLSRNLAFIAALMESGVEFVAADMPHANRLTVHILAAVAEHERQMISERTRAALQAAKKRGKVLGKTLTSVKLQNAAGPLPRPMRGGLRPTSGRSSRRSCVPVRPAITPLLPSSTSAMFGRPGAGHGRMCRWGRFSALSRQAPPSRERRPAALSGAFCGALHRCRTARGADPGRSRSGCCWPANSLYRRNNDSSSVSGFKISDYKNQ
jgi:Resolvase, N terminal domain